MGERDQENLDKKTVEIQDFPWFSRISHPGLWRFPEWPVTNGWPSTGELEGLQLEPLGTGTV